VSSLSFKIAKLFTRHFKHLFVFALASTVTVHVKAWDVDMSRRQEDLKSNNPIQMHPGSMTVVNEEGGSVLSRVMEAGEPEQEIVILNTPQGFVPDTIRLKKGFNYKLHIVNVNDKEKNVSFILDAFSEHHATYFGEPKSFAISPKADGIFSFQCPETARQGKLVIYSDSARKTASE
jgi:hypothetical protein